jgi:hypothetical protein
MLFGFSRRELPLASTTVMHVVSEGERHRRTRPDVRSSMM